MSAMMFPMMATGIPAVEVALPGEEVTAEDLGGFGQPVEELVSDTPPAIPERSAQGMAFDWAALDYRTQEEFDAKPPEHRQLIYEMEVLGNRYSQEQAAKRILEIQNSISALNNPKAQIAAEKAQAETERLRAENAAKQAESEQGRAKINHIFKVMDTYEAELDALVGPGAGALQTIDLVSNPDRYSRRKEIATLTKYDILEAAKNVKPVSNDELRFLEEMVPNLNEPSQVWRNYFARSRSILGKGLVEQPAPRGEAANKSNMGTATPASPSPTATPAPAQAAPSGRIEDKPAEITVKGIRYIRTERGTYVEAK